MTNRIRLLLVEDSASDAALLRAELMHTRLFFDIDHVQRLAQAVEQLRDVAYDLILLDLSLPDSHGLDTLLQIRAVEPDVPVVILSGYEDAQIGLEAVKHGAQDYLLKGRTDAALLERALQYAIERAAIVEELTESRQRYRELFDATLEAIFVHDDEMILNVNGSCEVMFGAHRDHLIGQSIGSFLTWDKQLSADGQPAGLLHLGTAWRVDGSIFPVEIGSVTMILERRPVTLTTLRDISARMRAEQHALDLTLERERVAMLRDFLHAASHDLRTPITTLLTGVYLIQRNLTDLSDWALSEDLVNPQGVADRVNGIVQRTERLNTEVVRLQQIVDDLLDMDRLERMNFAMAQADLNSLVRITVDRFRMTAAERRVSLTFDVIGDVLMVAADAVELAKAISALIDNAVRYTVAGGYVLVTTRIEPGLCVLEVKDTGKGIESSHLPHIFERFYRADQARSSDAGVGLGLSKVKVIIEAHRGKIEVSSLVGEGSVFRVILPALTPF